MLWRVAIFVLLTGCSGPVLGERVIEVFLDYNDRTNIGLETTGGLVTIDTRSGDVLLTLRGAEVLGEDDRYEGWLRGGGESPLSFGRFEVSERGEIDFAANLGALSESTFTRVELTVESEPDSSPDPGVRVSVGGRIDF